MATQNTHIERLIEARGNLVQERRDVVERIALGDSYAASARAPQLVQLQEAVEAVDRALADERQIAAKSEDRENAVDLTESVAEWEKSIKFQKPEA